MSKDELVTWNGETVSAEPFRASLIAWGQSHFRSFTWRTTDDPYALLLAEIMLHRTQVSQVVPLYHRFLARYPTVSKLASADRDEVHSLLYSLGLRWRIDLLLDMARDIVGRFDETIPRDRDKLLSLPGVSEYIASAVRCFAWGIPDVIIDTNVVRVVTRLFGLPFKDSLRRSHTMLTLARSLMDDVHPKAYNYALLDLAESVCTKKRLPDCKNCPVRRHCAFGKNHRDGY